jgi:O-antigen/teichoic acid export membrane protein
VVVGSFALLLAFFGGSIAVLVFTENYNGLQTVLNLLVIAKLFEGFSHSASGGLFAMERIKANFWVDVILMLVTITAAILLILPLGVLGAAWTTLIGSATGAILRSFLLVSFLRLRSS